MPTYCSFVSDLDGHDLHRIYHDSQYGFPLHDDRELFGRLILEINQAGLSWITILRKQKNFRMAYDHFDVAKIASYGEKDFARLLSDPGIIRNKMKISAAVFNANRVMELQAAYGSFENWLNHFHPLPPEKWTALFRKTFRFTGREIVREFLVSTGYLKGAHVPECPIFKEVMKQKPPWTQDNPGMK